MEYLSYFLLLDSFGVNMSFYVKGYRDYRSHLGGLITIIIYVATVICAVIFARNLWIKSNPTVNTASAVYPNPTKLYYPDNFFFLFSVNVDSIPFIDEKIYRAVGYISYKVNSTEEISQQNISLDICSNVFDESFKYYDSIKHLNLSNFYCISLDKNLNNGIEKEDLFINEFWGHEGFQMLQVKVYNCQAIAEDKRECADHNEIKSKLKSPIISYYTLKNYIDTNNYKNPYVPGLQETFYYVSYKKYMSATEYLKHVQITSDYGLLFYKEENNSDSTVDSMVEYSEADPEDGKIFTMSIQLTNKIDYYTRSYYKIQDLGADIGAIYGALHMIFSILFQLYNTSKLFNNIINSFFLIKEDFKPLYRENKAFINLKRKFYKDLKLNISIKQKKSFIVNHNNNNNDNINENDNKDDNIVNNITNNLVNNITNNLKSRYEEQCMKTNSSFSNENMQRILVSKDKFFDFNGNQSKNNYLTPKNDNLNNNNIHTQPKPRRNSLVGIISQKNEEEKKRIKMNFSCIDRFLCLYLIDICRNKVNRYSYYNLYYQGKDYIIRVLDISNYLKYNHFLQMFFLINGRETKELYEYITTPILSSNYVGPRFEVEKNLLENNFEDL